MAKQKKDTRSPNEIRIFIEAVPPSANKIWSQNRYENRTFLTGEYRKFISAVCQTIRLTGQRYPDDWPYCYAEIIVHPRRRLGDADNRTKPTLDALTKAGFWIDDKVVAETHARFGRPDKNGCTLVILTRRETKFGNPELSPEEEERQWLRNQIRELECRLEAIGRIPDRV